MVEQTTLMVKGLIAGNNGTPLVRVQPKPQKKLNIETVK